MIIFKGFLNAVIIALLYMMYRYGNVNDTQMFWVYGIGVGLIIRKLYIISKFT